MRFARLFFVIGFAALATGCMSQAWHDCVDRGIAYYKQTGSYPVMTGALLQGKETRPIVEARCKKSTHAF